MQSQMAEEEKQQLLRKLRDKYIDKFGYAKKIVIDDCLDQFVRAHAATPSALDLKELDIVMKKRILGKDVVYEKMPEPPKGKGSFRREHVQSSDGNRFRKAGSEALNSAKVPRKQPSQPGKAVEMEQVTKVTDKITSMPAPKLKKKVEKAEPFNPKAEQPKPVDQKTIAEILSLDEPAQPDPKKGTSKWGIIDIYETKKLQQEIADKKQRKKDAAEEYKKILDQQVTSHNQVKKLREIEATAEELKLKGQHNPKHPIDEKQLLSEYEAIQKEIQKHNLVPHRGSSRSQELEKQRLQNKLSASLVHLGKPAQTESEKQDKITKYRDVLDQQINQKVLPADRRTKRSTSSSKTRPTTDSSTESRPKKKSRSASSSLTRRRRGSVS